MSAAMKGTTTSLASLFPAEESQKAAKRVQEAISDRQQELDRLRAFATDNTNLINRVQKLPDELSHEIMVPFGNAAFFPGRLIHTNEFLVLLGEGYYADRTGKQTVEILQRRGKGLEAQVDSMKATMLDLQAEARFFYSTAGEAAEGLIEIREDYVEEPQTQKEIQPDSNSRGSSEADKAKIPAEDNEYARIMARLDELEKEELAAEGASDSDEDANVKAGYDFSTSQIGKEELAAESASDSDEDENVKDAFGFSTSQHTFRDDKQKLTDQVQKSRGKEQFTLTAALPIGGGSRQHLADQSFADSNVPLGAKGTEKPPLPLESKERLHRYSVPKPETSAEDAVTQTSKMGSGGRKAFTGSIVEHSHGLQSNKSAQTSTSNQQSGVNPVKPVSRFKMQKGGR